MEAEAKAIGVKAESEAVDEITASTSLIEMQSKLMVAANSGCCHNYKIELCGAKPILRCGEAPFLFIFVV